MMIANHTVPGQLQAPSNDSSSYKQPVNYGNYKYGYHSFLIAVAVLVALHNLLVLVLYSKRRTLRNSTNMLLASTACADILTGVLLIPSLICSAALHSQTYDLDILYFSSNVITDFVTLAIVLNILMVTVERYISLCHPYFHPEIARKSVIISTIFGIWTFSIFGALIQLVWSYRLLVGEDVDDLTTEYTIYSLTILIGVFFVPSLIMIFCLISMFAVVKKFAKEDTLRGRSKSKGFRSQGKAVFVFFAMFLNMFVCWSPLMCIRLVLDTKEDFRPSKDVLEVLVALRCCSSFSNPAIYVWCKKDFKRAFLRVICKQRKTRSSTTKSRRNVQRSRGTLKESCV